MDELGPRGVMARLHCFGEDQPERCAAAGWRPWLTVGRQDGLDALAPLDRGHAWQEASIAHPEAFEGCTGPTVLGREAHGLQQAQTQRAGLCDL